MKDRKLKLQGNKKLVSSIFSTLFSCTVHIEIKILYSSTRVQVISLAQSGNIRGLEICLASFHADCMESVDYKKIETELEVCHKNKCLLLRKCIFVNMSVWMDHRL